MKHPKWLLTIVIVLLIINVIFYSLWYALDVQGKLKNKLESYLSETLDGNFFIEKISMNERLITINHVTFVNQNSDIRASIKQIQIRYNLFRIVFTGFNIKKAIKRVTIFEPDVFFKFESKPHKKVQKKPFELPDLTSYFDEIAIKEGKFHFVFSTSINDSVKVLTEEMLNDIEIKAVNNDATIISVSAKSKNGGDIKLTSELRQGYIAVIDARIDRFKPYKMRLQGFDNLSTELTAQVNYKKASKDLAPEYDINSILRNTTAIYDKYNLSVPYIHIQGNQNVLQYAIRQSQINNHKFSASGFIRDLLEQPFLNSSLAIQNLDLGDFTPELKGTAVGNAHVEGKLANLTANGAFDIPSFNLMGEYISNLSVQIDFADNNINLHTNSFLWRNQLSEINGNFNIDELTSNLHVLSNPFEYHENFNLNTDIDAKIDLSKGQVKSEININQLGFVNSDLSFRDFQGYIKLENPSGLNRDFDFNLEVKNQGDVIISAFGNLGKPDIIAKVQLQNTSLEEYLAYTENKDLPMDLSGVINATMHDSLVLGNMILDVDVLPPHSIKGTIVSDFVYDINTQNGELLLRTDAASAKEIPFSLLVDTKLEDYNLFLNNLNLDDKLTAHGRVNLKDFLDMDFAVNADSIVVDKYWNMLFYDMPAPFSTTLAMELDYNPENEKQVNGYLVLDSLIVESVQPISARLDFSGSKNNILINGNVGTSDKNRVSIEGSVDLKPELTLSAKGSFDNLIMQDILIDVPISGNIRGDLSWQKTSSGKDPQQSFACNIAGSRIEVEGIPIDSLEVIITQTNNVLWVEKLYMTSQNLLNLTGNGALDYNLLTNNYVNGNNLLNLYVEGDVLSILRKYIPYFKVAKGRIKSRLTIGADDNGINISSGSVSLSRGILHLQDQVNPFEKLNLEATITKNILSIDTLSCQFGLGKLFIRNEIDTGDDNFYIGPLNLGYFLIKTDNQGVQVSIPGYLPPDTFVNAVLRGQNTPEATVKGPFDDMEFIAEVIASNGSAVYPANTKNILQLVNVFKKKQDREEIPLPFTLDLHVITENNIKYVTYPADLLIQPKSFLRLTYDGTLWNAKEANFRSEKGTLDFYGTIFDVDYVQIDINEKRGILAVNGIFTKKAADGTLVTLAVLTNPLKGEDLFNQLEFKLSSDNPQDVSATQVLSRLRYNRNMDELSPEQRQSLLQDEAMQLVSTSVSTTYVSQFLSPIENKIRRFFKLDSFSITTGFVQNLFVEFTSKNDTNASFSNPDNLNADIMQFSSSILLNNLSVSMSKYIGNNVFLDYEVNLQETTDLAKKTKLDVYHNASVRLNLPLELRISYTFSIRPSRESNSHEVMIQRSFRF